MFRMITALAALALITLSTAACTEAGALQGSRGYCDTTTGGTCAGLEGNGDCQLCPDGARSARTLY